MMEKTDVLIVGAGAAGLFTALNLNPEIQVTLLEKQSFPPFKLCGGLLCAEAFTCLARFNPPPQLYHQPATLGMEIADLDNGLFFSTPEKMHNLNRRALYGWLADMLGENVTLVDNCKVLSFREEGRDILVTATGRKGRQREFRTRVLIGAGGFFSPVRRCFFPGKRGFVPSIQYTLASTVSLKRIKFIFTREITAHYYIWLIPRDGQLILGTAMEGDKYRALPQLVATQWGLKGEIQGRRGHPITLLGSLEEMVPGQGQVLLVGEAAGLVRPSSGEGLSLTFHSALAAAEAVNKAVDNPFPHYEPAIEKLKGLLSRELATVEIITNPEKRKQLWQKQGGNHA